MITLSVSWNSSGYKNYMLISIKNSLIAELAERSPINIQNSSNPSAKKIWMYDHTTIQGATFNMHGQMYCGHTNAMALFSSPVVSALGSELDDPVLVLAGARHCALATCGEKKNASSTVRLG